MVRLSAVLSFAMVILNSFQCFGQSFVSRLPQVNTDWCVFEYREESLVEGIDGISREVRTGDLFVRSRMNDRGGDNKTALLESVLIYDDSEDRSRRQQAVLKLKEEALEDGDVSQDDVEELVLKSPGSEKETYPGGRLPLFFLMNCLQQPEPGELGRQFQFSGERKLVRCPSGEWLCDSSTTQTNILEPSSNMAGIITSTSYSSEAVPFGVVRYEHKHMYISHGRFAAWSFVSLSLVEIGVSVVK